MAGVALQRWRGWRPLLDADSARTAAVTLGIPAGVFLAIVAAGHSLATVLGAMVAMLFVATAARFPGAALGVLLVYVPVQTLPLAYLYKQGVSSTLVRDLGYVKEAVILGVGLRVLSHAKKWRAADAVDVLALGYVAIVTAYFLLPFIVPRSLGGNPTIVRLNAWRADALFVVLFLICRRLDLPPRVLARLTCLAVGMGIVVAGFAVWESVDSASYNRVMVTTLAVTRYLVYVLKAPLQDPFSVLNRGTMGGHTFLRDGGPFLDPLALGFYALIPFGIALERATDDRFRLWWAVGSAAAGAAVALSITRSAILGAIVAVLLTVGVGRPGTRLKGRSRLTVAVVVAMAFAAAFGVGSAVSTRFGSLFSQTQNADNRSHVTAIQQSFHVLATHPGGLGLGANPATGLLYGTSNVTVSEDAYLQVGTELGIATMIVFILLLLALLRTLFRRARSLVPAEHRCLAGGVWLAGVALALGGLFLHVWATLPVALSFWALAGLSLSTPKVPDR